MEYEVYPIFTLFTVMGFCVGVCMGGGMLIYWDNYMNPPHKTRMMEKVIFNQRDSLRSLRLDFNKFKNEHAKELLNIMREALRSSPRSVITEEPSE
jgi:hypothetical protein